MVAPELSKIAAEQVSVSSWNSATRSLPRLGCAPMLRPAPVRVSRRAKSPSRASMTATAAMPPSMVPAIPMSRTNIRMNAV